MVAGVEPLHPLDCRASRVPEGPNPTPAVVAVEIAAGDFGQRPAAIDEPADDGAGAGVSVGDFEDREDLPGGVASARVAMVALEDAPPIVVAGGVVGGDVDLLVGGLADVGAEGIGFSCRWDGVPETTSPWARWGRSLLAAASGAGVAWIAFGANREVPLFDQFDLAVHETGHLVTAFMPRLMMFMAGSAAQVLFPVAMAVYFWLRRRDLAAAGFCLAWAGTSARDVSIYTGDAIRQALPLIGGGEHDWAYILGPNGFDALEHTAGVAHAIETAGLVMAVGGVVLAAWPILAGRRDSLPAAEVGSERLPSDPDAWAAAAALPFKHDREAA